MKKWILGMVVIGLLAPAALMADTVHLTDGSAVEGKVEKTADGVVVTFDGGVKRAISAGDIRTIEYGPTTLEKFQTQFESLNRALDTKGLMELADWCSIYGMQGKVRGVYEAVLSIDQNHRAAHLGLGHVEWNDAWYTRDEYMARMGFTKQDNRWMPLEMKAMNDGVKEYTVAMQTVSAEIVKNAKLLASSKDEKTTVAAENVLRNLEQKYPALKGHVKRVKAWASDMNTQESKVATLELRLSQASLKPFRRVSVLAQPAAQDTYSRNYFWFTPGSPQEVFNGFLSSESVTKPNGDTLNRQWGVVQDLNDPNIYHYVLISESYRETIGGSVVEVELPELNTVNVSTTVDVPGR